MKNGDPQLQVDVINASKSTIDQPEDKCPQQPLVLQTQKNPSHQEQLATTLTKSQAIQRVIDQLSLQLNDRFESVVKDIAGLRKTLESQVDHLGQAAPLSWTSQFPPCNVSSCWRRN
ncbi:hypothetical protein WDU94_005798 [Cyamophila willieti]